MTIEQLKAHMDRRFDRLERTKADRSELRRLAARVQRACATSPTKRFAKNGPEALRDEGSPGAVRAEG